MTAKTETLVERARLAVDYPRRYSGPLWWERFLYEDQNGLGAVDDRAVADAQLAKALWAVVDWLEAIRDHGEDAHNDNCAGFETMCYLLRDQLEAAGLERPQE